MIERNYYLINSKNDIIQLKEDLMTENTSTTDRHNNISNSEISSIISVVKQILNSEKGLIFEENIRGNLKYEYELDESAFPRKVIYRIVKIGETVEIVMNCKNSNIQINNKPYLFKLNKDNSLSIIDPNKTSNKYTFLDNNGKITYYLNKECISIYPHDEIEVDGIFFIKNNYQIKMFDNNEIEEIFTNLKKNEENKFNKFKFAIMEVKLNPASIKDLISQIKKDALFFGSITKEKIVYIGFVGSGEIKKNINFKDILNIKCVIYQIKTNKLCRRNLLQNIDWITCGNVIKLNKKIDKLREEIDELKANFKEEIDGLKKLIIYYLEGHNSDSWIGKKTKRPQKNE